MTRRKLFPPGVDKYDLITNGAAADTPRMIYQHFIIKLDKDTTIVVNIGRFFTRGTKKILGTSE
jgi:hypothetical protein